MSVASALSRPSPASRISRASLTHAMSAISTALLRTCSLLLCLAAGSRQISIKEFVVPKEVEVGKDAELRCQYQFGTGEQEVDLFVKWWWTPDSSPSDDRIQIYQRIAGHDAESIHHYNASQIEIKDNDTIVLLDVSPVDSGTYECEVSNIQEVRQRDSLIVFTVGTAPEINYTVIQSEEETDDLLIECEAEDVAPLPILIVTFQGKVLNISEIVEDTNKDGLYRIYANATVSAENIEDGEIRCEVSFNQTFEHPPYVDVETYTPPGRGSDASTAPPEDTTEPEATPESLPNFSGDGNQLSCPWVVLALTAVLVHLSATLL